MDLDNSAKSVKENCSSKKVCYLMQGVMGTFYFLIYLMNDGMCHACTICQIVCLHLIEIDSLLFLTEYFMVFIKKLNNFKSIFFFVICYCDI